MNELAGETAPALRELAGEVKGKIAAALLSGLSWRRLLPRAVERDLAPNHSPNS